MKIESGIPIPAPRTGRKTKRFDYKYVELEKLEVGQSVFFEYDGTDDEKARAAWLNKIRTALWHRRERWAEKGGEPALMITRTVYADNDTFLGLRVWRVR